MAKKQDTISIGFEEKIWKAADILRGNLSASQYEGVVLGLIFLKYISDRFEQKFQELQGDEPILNAHNKDEYPPAHTAEHILNGTMVKMFGCRRAKTAHVERKKSKLDYDFPRALSPDEVAEVEARVNQVIAADMPVTMEFANQNDVAERFDLERLPEGASSTVRIVHVGNYDECLCAGGRGAREKDL